MLFIAILMKQQKADFNFSRKIQKLYFCSTHWAKITKAVLDHRKNCKNQKCRALPLAQYAEAGARARDICTWAARSRPAVSATHTQSYTALSFQKLKSSSTLHVRAVGLKQSGGWVDASGRSGVALSVGRWVDRPAAGFRKHSNEATRALARLWESLRKMHLIACTRS